MSTVQLLPGVLRVETTGSRGGIRRQFQIWVERRGEDWRADGSHKTYFYGATYSRQWEAAQAARTAVEHCRMAEAFGAFVRALAPAKSLVTELAEQGLTVADLARADIRRDILAGGWAQADIDALAPTTLNVAPFSDDPWAEVCGNCGQRADWHDAYDGACSDDDYPHPYSVAADVPGTCRTCGRACGDIDTAPRSCCTTG